MTMRRPTIKEKVPNYLHPFIAEQDSSLYTAIDHASWRYIMRVSKTFFARHAHQKYVNGLAETGISTECIPRIEDMDAKLEQFGWRACAIVGFIPPAVFMEFLSLGILPIACDMRRHEHLAYTPAPDIVHEAAGHAPVIADREYADYLYEYGEVARKVIFSDQDMALYEAIRLLSDIKEAPQSTAVDIADAQVRLEAATAKVTYASEATQLSRMGWWTIEYGLVGDLNDPKIYGAGLLSSLSESFHCFGADVKKIPFSVDCIEMSFDITRPQPQLYVTPDFQTLRDGLEQFASTLAFRRGGLLGLKKAQQSATVTTAELDSGLQIGGLLEEVIKAPDGQPAYLRYHGACQLARGDIELEGHGPKYHAQGFGSPLGKLRRGKSPQDLTDGEIRRLSGWLEFESGVTVEGTFVKSVREGERALVLVFEKCTVTMGDRVLFQPEWGTYDMACGAAVTSVFGGPPDRGSYLAATGGYTQAPARPKSNLTPENREINKLYEKVRQLRESSKAGNAYPDSIQAIIRELDEHHANDWLLRLELLEFKGEWQTHLRQHLTELAAHHADLKEMIERGLAAL